MKKFKQYRHTQIAEMRPLTEQEANSSASHLQSCGISIRDVDIANGSPNTGDMIARNPKNHNDKWLVAKQYFEDNFEPI